LEDSGVKEVKQGLVGVLFYSVTQISVQLFFPENFGEPHTTGTKDHEEKTVTNDEIIEGAVSSASLLVTRHSSLPRDWNRPKIFLRDPL
jgi:hypothetical protein